MANPQRSPSPYVLARHTGWVTSVSNHLLSCFIRQPCGPRGSRIQASLLPVTIRCHLAWNPLGCPGYAWNSTSYRTPISPDRRTSSTLLQTESNTARSNCFAKRTDIRADIFYVDGEKQKFTLHKYPPEPTADHSASFHIVDAFHAVATRSCVVRHHIYNSHTGRLFIFLLVTSVSLPIIPLLVEFRPEIFNSMFEEVPPLRNHIVHLVMPQLRVRRTNSLDDTLVRDLVGTPQLFRSRTQAFDSKRPRTA